MNRHTEDLHTVDTGLEATIEPVPDRHRDIVHPPPPPTHTYTHTTDTHAHTHVDTNLQSRVPLQRRTISLMEQKVRTSLVSVVLIPAALMQKRGEGGGDAQQSGRGGRGGCKSGYEKQQLHTNATDSTRAFLRHKTGYFHSFIHSFCGGLGPRLGCRWVLEGLLCAEYG